MTSSELNKAVSSGNIITNEMVSIFKELDMTPSVATQASLNNMLIDIRNRIKNGADITIEGTNHQLTIESFDEFLKDTLEEYSCKLYNNSIK